MNDAPILLSDRLTLRPLADVDLETLWQIWSETGVSEHLFSPPSNTDQFASEFQNMRDPQSVYAMWLLLDRATQAPIGRCGFFRYGSERQPELVYLLSSRYWGRGLATEAARTALDYGFHQKGWSSTVSLVRPNNLRSKNVLGKLGMQHVENCRIRGVDAELHRLDRSRWLRLSPKPGEDGVSEAAR